MYVYYGKCFLSAFDHKMKDCRPTCKVRLLWCRWSVPITRARCSSCLLGGALHTSRCYVPWCLGMRSPVTMAATSLETIMRIVNVKRVKGNLAFQLKLVISEFYMLLSFNRQGSGAYRDKTPLHPPSSNGLVSCGKYTLRETDKRRKRKQQGEVETESCESSTLSMDGKKKHAPLPQLRTTQITYPSSPGEPSPKKYKGSHSHCARSSKPPLNGTTGGSGASNGVSLPHSTARSNGAVHKPSGQQGLKRVRRGGHELMSLNGHSWQSAVQGDSPTGRSDIASPHNGSVRCHRMSRGNGRKEIDVLGSGANGVVVALTVVNDTDVLTRGHARMTRTAVVAAGNSKQERMTTNGLVVACDGGQS